MKKKDSKEKFPKMIFKYVGRYKWSYLWGIITLFIVDYTNLFIPEYTGNITDGLKAGVLDFNGVLSYVYKILACSLIITAGRFFWRFFIFGSRRKIERDIRIDLFDHLVKLSNNFFNKNKTGDLMSYFTNDLNAVQQAVGMAVVSTFDAIIMTIMVICKMIFSIDPKLTIAAVIPLIFIVFGGIFYGKKIEVLYREKQEAFSSLSDKVQESISGVRVIKAFVREEDEFKSFDISNKYNKDANMKVVKVVAFVEPLLNVIIGISNVIAIIYGGSLVVSGKVTPGQFVAFIQYIGMLVWPMLAVGESINAFSQGIASMRRIQNIFDTVPEVTDTMQTDIGITSLEGNIEIKDLTFRYPEGVYDVLSNVNLNIKKGENLAIIGGTGSGKSTITNLLVRLYNVPDGTILFDGHDINQIPLSVLRENIAYVPQDSFMFSDTLQTNIAFGAREYRNLKNKKKHFKIFMSRQESMEAYLEKELTERSNTADKVYDDLEKVIESAKLAEVHENIMNFPKQYSTMVGERGVTVSGGQKQRSSIARALMKDSPILILDDSLSAVDTDTEEKILNNLKKYRKNKTTITIAHRISTIQDADHILVLDDGKVVEYGSHSSLMKADGKYAALFRQQQLEAQLSEDIRKEASK